ncbi:YcaO-like family protein [Flavobacterium saccharophilum]|uniref:Thiazole/oxazole-forming peptide maturase, SagD family component n=1 Tax=Flavobacterium saccharophilum TaxID=29534 RepID=A0A1M7ME12_9FLAO|nr:YcaO-like family protein [Flavobacterium saccharophilum]SHM88578.1 thiazole/oxazole-forming peptide maturase, SagD family component [Flavobacterium saccharophilum]
MDYEIAYFEACYILEKDVFIQGDIFGGWTKFNYSLDNFFDFSYEKVITNKNNIVGYGGLFNLISDSNSTSFINSGIHYLTFDYIARDVRSIVEQYLKRNIKLIVTFAFDNIYTSNLIDKYDDFLFFINVVLSKSVNPNYLASIIFGQVKLVKNDSTNFDVFFAEEKVNILNAIADCNCINILEFANTNIVQHKFNPNPEFSYDFLDLITHDLKVKVKLILSENKDLYITHARYLFPINHLKDDILNYDLLKYSSGCDNFKDKALLKAVMEGAERYLSMCKWETTYSSVNNLRADYIHPNKMQKLYASDEIFFDPCIEYHWIDALDLNNNNIVKINSDYVTYPSINKLPLHLSNSNGFAIHSELEKAKSSALYELIERDNLLFTFFFKKSCFRINNDKLQSPNTALVKYISDMGYKLYLIYSSVDIDVHSVFAFVFNNVEEDRPYCITSASCNFSLEEAVNKALKEVITGIVYALEKKDWKQFNSVNEVEQLLDHRDFYFNSTSKIALTNILECNFLQDEDMKKVEFLCDQLESEYLESQFTLKNLQLYRIINEIKFHDCTFYLVKYLSPDLIPMDFGHKLLRLPELSTLERRGKENINLEKLVYPHPFA